MKVLMSVCGYVCQCVGVGISVKVLMSVCGCGCQFGGVNVSVWVWVSVWMSVYGCGCHCGLVHSRIVDVWMSALRCKYEDFSKIS